ncbi:hypothetical protein Dimus_018707 [Dionaea muscipula]
MITLIPYIQFLEMMMQPIKMMHAYLVPIVAIELRIVPVQRSTTRFIGYALCAAAEALDDANWIEIEHQQKERTVMRRIFPSQYLGVSLLGNLKEGYNSWMQLVALMLWYWISLQPGTLLTSMRYLVTTFKVVPRGTEGAMSFEGTFAGLVASRHCWMRPGFSWPSSVLSDSENEGLMVKALPIGLIWRKRVIRSKIVREGWMKDNGLSNVMEQIKRKKWENLFKSRELVHVDSVKEFYARMNVIHLKKKDVVKSSVKGVAIEFDHVKLASILGVPRKNGICEYIKDVWEESKYTKPLEITRRFANDETLPAARRVKSGEMKPFQRFIHFLVMKNVVLRFGKRDTSSFMDLTYMDHLMARRLVNLPRVMMRHMMDKKGEEPKRYDYFEETFLIMCKLKRENGVWWVGTGENRRRDDEIDAQEEEAEEEEEDQTEFDWEAVIDEAAEQGESGSDDQFYDAQVDVEEPLTETPDALAVPASPEQIPVLQKETAPSKVDPSCPSGRIPEVVMNKLQAEFERARANRIQADLEKAQAENARLLSMLQQAQFKPKP